EEKHLYYVAIDFSGVNIYPGGQDNYKKEVQFRIRNEKGVWDNSNDPSYIDIDAVPSGTLTKAKNMALYEGNKLVFGTEPNEKNTGDAIKDIKPAPPENNDSQNNGSGNGGSGGGNVSAVSDKGTVSVTLDQQQAGGKGSTIQFALKIKNTGSTGIDLKQLTADFLFTKDGKDMVFECDYADINGSSYRNVTGDVSGRFSSASGKDTDTKCTISMKNGVLAGGETLTLNIRIHSSDWSEIDLGNDYSGGNADHIAIKYNGKTI
ncbi:MAG: hypothetical protein J6X60_09740, partial [Ruminiclostridium sp.]|nr:hypothetical protein [Ruminiclostridium sp.]